MKVIIQRICVTRLFYFRPASWTSFVLVCLFFFSLSFTIIKYLKQQFLTICYKEYVSSSTQLLTSLDLCNIFSYILPSFLDIGQTINTTLQNISVFTSYCIDCAYVSCYKRSKILYMLFKEKYKQTRYLYNTWLHCSIDRFFSLLSFSSVFILLVCLFKIICFQLCNRIIQQYYDYIVQN